MDKNHWVDATLAPNVGPADELRRDTGIYSSEDLATPDDFQRTREYRSSYSGNAQSREDSAGIFGPQSDLEGRQPAQSGTDKWPETPGGFRAALSTPGHPSYVTEARGGGRR